MILHDENYAFFVAFKKNKTYALRWTNQQSKSCGIGQKNYSAPLATSYILHPTSYIIHPILHPNSGQDYPSGFLFHQPLTALGYFVYFLSMKNPIVLTCLIILIPFPPCWD